MNTTRSTTLARLLRQAGDDLAQALPPPALRHPAMPRNRAWRWSGALACSVVLGVSVLLMLPPPGDTLASDFVPLVDRARWPAEAQAAWIVRTELPASRLATLGLPYDPAQADAPVRAELLLHPSGDVLAVRVLR